jgi:hypothetical protein
LGVGSKRGARHRTRAERSRAHILETKRAYWKIIADACTLSPIPETLEDLMRYELEQIAKMDAATRAAPLEYGSHRMTVASLIRLSARHSVWHAGQIALTRPD